MTAEDGGHRCGHASGPMRTFREDYAKPDFLIKHVELDFNLHESNTEVKAELSICRNEGVPPTADLLLDGDELELLSLSLATKHPQGKGFSESRELKADAKEFELLKDEDDGNLRVASSLLPAAAGEIFKLTTHVKINPAENSKLQGVYVTGPMLCSHCEAQGFRRITFFLDRPDVMATYKVRLEADKTKYPILLSNGNKLSAKSIEGSNRHEAIYEDQFPKPSYLFALVAGDLAGITDTHTRPDGRPVEINIWCEPHEAKKLDWAMKVLKLTMKWDEDKFGRVYDLDVFNLVAVRYFNMGAMENKSLNIFNSAALLASPEISTDDDFFRVMTVVSHEYLHNWTGNRVTCRDWFQLTLKEGLTVYREEEFSRDMGSTAVARIQQVIYLRGNQFLEDAGPMAHPIRPDSYLAIDNFYTTTIYEKGAEVLRMYQRFFGVDGFRKGMDLYFKKNDGKAVTCDDYRACMEEANGRDMTQFFNTWYFQAGTPIVTLVKSWFDPEKKRFEMIFKQRTEPTPGQPIKKPFHIPIAVGLIGVDSKKEVVPTQMLELTTEEAQFGFDTSETCIPSVLRDFSAPVRLEQELSNEELTFLMSYDTDPFNKWEAGQKLATRLILERGEKSGAETAATVPPLHTLIIEAYRRHLKPTVPSDRHFQAIALRMPDDDELASAQIGSTTCFRSNRDATMSLKGQIAQALDKEFREVYTTLTEEINKLGGHYEPNEEAVGRRQLRNVCLSYLTTKRGGELPADALELAYKHFMAADNMTDKSAALQCIVEMPSKEKEHALQKFFDDAAGEDLVTNKWFGIQAGCDLPTTVDTVKALRNHPQFDILSPNRIRALYVRFALNRPQFHRADGLGYKLVADAVIEVDKTNGSVAARLCSQLSHFKQLPEKQKDLVKAELERILATPGLSTHTYEIASTALGKRA